MPVTAARDRDIVHDSVMLDALREWAAAEAAISQAIIVLRGALT